MIDKDIFLNGNIVNMTTKLFIDIDVDKSSGPVL